MIDTTTLDLSSSYYYPAPIESKIYVDCRMLKKRGTIFGFVVDLKNEEGRCLVTGKVTKKKLDLNDGPIFLATTLQERKLKKKKNYKNKKKNKK